MSTSDIRIDSSSDVPIRQQLIEQIIFRIATGAMDHGPSAAQRARTCPALEDSSQHGQRRLSGSGEEWNGSPGTVAAGWWSFREIG